MEYHVEETTIEALTRMLIETPSPVSYYEEIHPLMERLAKKYGYTLTYDRKRTAYIRVEGEDTTKTVCVGAHLDTIGLMVRHINDNGTLALRNLGGINYNNIEGCSVQVHTRDGNTITGLLACTSHSTHVFDDARSAVREESNMMVILDELVHSSDEVRWGLSMETSFPSIRIIDLQKAASSNPVSSMTRRQWQPCLQCWRIYRKPAESRSIPRCSLSRCMRKSDTAAPICHRRSVSMSHWISA